MENECCVVAVVGNPKAGKSTVFNGMTGSCRHTGNWWGDDGKIGMGKYRYSGQRFITVDCPDEYTLLGKDYKKADVVVVVADATRLELGLHLLKQVMKKGNAGETCPPVVLCINFWDEARHMGIEIDLELLEDVLQIPVVACCARRKTYLDDLKAAVYYAAKPGNKELFQYNCLDFSPGKLTRECLSAAPGAGVRRIIADGVLTNPVLGKLIWLFLLAGILKLAVMAAGEPSLYLWNALSRAQGWLERSSLCLGGPSWLWDALIKGGFQALSWTVTVMLPPLAVFLFCFTLLEDWGILPRVSYSMDPVFETCGGCGGQCITMALGLGCNAAGVSCCKSIHAPRERLAAVLTNSMIPCCGRFPVFIALIPLFFAAGPADSLAGSFSCALLFAALLLSAVYLSMSVSWLLSRTLLKKQPSGFALELPPYRRIRPLRALFRSFTDRTFILAARAVKAAVPAGIILWILANVVYAGNGQFLLAQTGTEGLSLLSMFTNTLDPIARLIGMDGVILAAFILAFPANELILPILMMAYTHTGSMVSFGIYPGFQLLSSNGWTWTTALCALVFTFFHWPCLTTCRAIARDNGGWKWSAAAICASTLPGILLCMGIALCSRIMGS